MLKLKTFKILIFLFTFSLFTFSLQAIFAQEEPPAGINLSLSPTFLNLLSDPGTSLDADFKLTNNNSFPEQLKLTLVKYINGPNGNPTITDIEAGDEFADWISFDEDGFSIGPNQTKTINLTILPPGDSSLGYYFAVLVTREQEVESVAGGAAISGSVALPVLLEIKSPNAKREAQITEFKTSKLFYEYLPAEFNVTFENTGNVHVSPVGDIFIDSMLNKNVGVVRVNEGRGNVLPGGTRTFESSWDDGFGVRVPKTEEGVVVLDNNGDKVFETKYDFGKADKFRFGRYTANLLMVYDSGERDIPVEAKVSFWVFPWKIIGGGALIVLLALIGVAAVLRPAFKKLKA